jgi:hypothetical protein
MKFAHRQNRQVLHLALSPDEIEALVKLQESKNLRTLNASIQTLLHTLHTKPQLLQQVINEVVEPSS